MKKGGIVSDIHAGSDYGLLPPNARAGANLFLQNDGQRYLWDCWRRLCEEFRKAKLDFIIVLGDVVDGEQRLNGGRELRTVLQTGQVEWAVEILSFLPDVPKYVVVGTPYHDGRSGEYAEFVAQRLNRVLRPPQGYPLAGTYSYHCLDLQIEGVDCNLLHEIPVSGALYRAVSIDREMVWSALAGKEGKAPRADFVARAHAHHFLHVEHASKHGIVNPCWQLGTPYTQRKSAYRMLPDIGATIVYVDGKAKSAGKDPIRIEKFLYPLPTVSGAVSLA